MATKKKETLEEMITGMKSRLNKTEEDLHESYDQLRQPPQATGEDLQGWPGVPYRLPEDVMTDRPPESIQRPPTQDERWRKAVKSMMGTEAEYQDWENRRMQNEASAREMAREEAEYQTAYDDETEKIERQSDEWEFLDSLTSGQDYGELGELGRELFDKVQNIPEPTNEGEQEYLDRNLEVLDEVVRKQRNEIRRMKAVRKAWRNADPGNVSETEERFWRNGGRK